MELIETIHIGNSVIRIARDEEGRIIVGGTGWYEFYDYLEMLEE